jgi:hypothetical protein
MEDRNNKYEDIINLPHHVSSRHLHMPLQNRAAQFSPFAALSGYAAVIRETQRQTQDRIELNEDVREELDQKLQMLQAYSGTEVEVEVTYFVPDSKKAGGSYETCSGKVRKIDWQGRRLWMEDGSVIPVEQICALESPLFQQFFECTEY